MTFSTRFRIFLWIAGGLFLLSLWLGNDQSTFIKGAESSSITRIQALAAGSHAFFEANILPIWKGFFIEQSLGFDHFGFRIPGVLIYLLSIVFFYLMARWVFGVYISILTILVLCSTLLINNLVKFAVADSWLFVAHSLCFLSLTLYLKQPKLLWKLLFWLSLLVGCLISPLSSFIFSAGPYVLFVMRHQQGAGLHRLYLPVIWPLLLLLSFVFQIDWADSGFFAAPFGFSGLKWYLLFIFIGMLPWTGFFVGAFADLTYKLKRKEELATIIGIWLLFAFLSMSPAVHLILSFMIAKQLIAFGQKNYPFRSLVRGFALFNLVMLFFGVTILMMGAYSYFRTLGFYATVGAAAILWIGNLIGVFGLYTLKRSLLVGGFVMSGVLTNFFFWIQINPLLEKERRGPKLAVEKLYELNKDNAEEVVVLEASNSNLLPYLNHYFDEKTNVQSVEKLAQLYDGERWFLIRKRDFELLQSKVPELKGKEPAFGLNSVFNPGEGYVGFR